MYLCHLHMHTIIMNCIWISRSCKITYAHNVYRPGHCCTTGGHGDCAVLCDNVALESKFPVDIIDY